MMKSYAGVFSVGSGVRDFFAESGWSALQHEIETFFFFLFSSLLSQFVFLSFLSIISTMVASGKHRTHHRTKGHSDDEDVAPSWIDTLDQSIDDLNVKRLS